MTTLNAGARDAARRARRRVHAATDVTGFGLLGHLRELLAGSGLAADVDAAAVPVIDGVRELLAGGMVAGGTQRNHAFVSERVDWGALAEAEQLLLADAQTSGGLLARRRPVTRRRPRRRAAAPTRPPPPRSSATPPTVSQARSGIVRIA